MKDIKSTKEKMDLLCEPFQWPGGSGCTVPSAVATIGAEELSYISSYQTLSADKIWKSYIASTKLVKIKRMHICAHRGKAVKSF